jgi:hypothetical protein
MPHSILTTSNHLLTVQQAAKLLGVFPEGIGKELFEKVVEALKEADCTHLALDTHVQNEKAVAIYEHMGFKKRLYNFYKPLKDL